MEAIDYNIYTNMHGIPQDFRNQNIFQQAYGHSRLERGNLALSPWNSATYKVIIGNSLAHLSLTFYAEIGM